ncbi:MAG: 3-deoxy-D-manno-octulosonic acid transferase [Candidatus Omnitrophica bacterium]|nr:3-deoxy-D-manno-octulosonic acid transferase [Candidatus Omnitrophota bacterium]MBU1895029.1 3-deoxy-D-manno-octulosonic acid transferase [Candidatus Omnitrophota bacterium]
MKFLYDLVFIIFSILYVPYLVFKGKAHKGFLEKFGFLPEKVTRLRNPVWIHSVSVGEAVLGVKLSAYLKKCFPDRPIIVSTTTRTGYDVVSKTQNGFVDAVFYYPMDLSFITAKVVSKIEPFAYIMIETELWPNMLRELQSRNIPVIMVNGRISDSSFKNYKRVKFLMTRILKCVSCFCMQTERDAEKIAQLGASKNKIFVSGNMKFDEGLCSSGQKGINPECFGFHDKDKVIVAGSTHFPEEIDIIDVYKDLKAERSNLRLIIAPRHVERTSKIQNDIEKAGLNCLRFSEILKSGVHDNFSNKIILVDTIGHLADIYSVADIVFIGGSLVKKGGQNPIEPARWGKIVIFGPNMFNFRKITDTFLENNAACKIRNKQELKIKIKEFLSNTRKSCEMSKNALKVIEQNSGAIEKTVEKIKGYLTR